MKAAVSLRAICKTYTMGDQEVHALRDVDMEFGTGEFWAIMGASGSGKSTMLNVLGCLDRPTSGEYLLDGRDVSKLDDDALSDIRLRYLGFVFQSFNLIPQLTVAENIALPLYYLGVSAEESRARAEALAARVGLSERLGHRPAELSGGQQQRVAIARALAGDPVLLLADEPTGNLDSKTSVQIMQLFQELYEQGKTVIVVTHEPDIDAYAHSHIVVKDGRILTCTV